jgi:hypothetical protein
MTEGLIGEGTTGMTEPLKGRGKTANREADVASCLATAERQVGNVKVEKLTADEKKVTQSLLTSIRGLLKDLRDRVNSGNYHFIEDDIEEWSGRANADLKQLNTLAKKSPRLTEVLVMVGNIESIKEAAKKL